MTRGEILDLCRRWKDAHDRRDLKTFASLYARDAALESPIAGDTPAREGVLKASEGFLNAFPDAVMTVEPPIIDGDRVTLVAEMSGKQVGAFMGLPPTGKGVRFRLVFLLDVADGLIVRDRRIYDFTGLLVQVGVLKAKPA